MIIVASIRMSGLHARGANGVETADLIWELFWQFIEASISVMMVSLIAFRTAFVIKSSRKKKRQWYAPRNIFSRRRPSPDDEFRVGSLPTIPSATMTGMRTFIRGPSNRESRIYDTLDPDWPLPSKTGLLAKTSSNSELQENSRSDPDVIGVVYR